MYCFGINAFRDIEIYNRCILHREKGKKDMLIPKKVFLTKGTGVHKDKLASFELALRDAGIEKCNLVSVSSILPPKCEVISKKEGLKHLKPGQITFCVLAKNETNEPNRQLTAAIGIAAPANNSNYGYLSEHHAFGESTKISGDYAEDLAATMLATTLGIPFDSDQAWDERKQSYHASGHIIKTTNCCKCAKGDKNGLWTSVVSAAVFILDWYES
jgi:arginine decarboxylase